MKGFLDQVRDAHTELGLPIDENTQKLITQAEEQGILKKEQMSTNDIMLEGLSAIIKALGGDLPDAFKKTADAGVDAGKKVGKAFDGTAHAVTGVGTALDKTDWAGWSQEAVDAARDAQAAVDAVSLGQSPGGIKEIPLRLDQAMRAFKAWEQQGVTSAQHVKRAVDAEYGGMQARVGMVHATTAAQEAAHWAPEEGGHTFNFSISAIDGADVQRVVEGKILPAMVKAMKRGYSLSEMRDVIVRSGPPRTK